MTSKNDFASSTKHAARGCFFSDKVPFAQEYSSVQVGKAIPGLCNSVVAVLKSKNEKGEYLLHNKMIDGLLDDCKTYGTIPILH